MKGTVIRLIYSANTKSYRNFSPDVLCTAGLQLEIEEVKGLLVACRYYICKPQKPCLRFLTLMQCQSEYSTKALHSQELQCLDSADYVF